MGKIDCKKYEDLKANVLSFIEELDKLKIYYPDYIDEMRVNILKEIKKPVKSEIPVIDVGKDFYHRLANRDMNSGDGKHTALEFRKKYLHDLDIPSAWTNCDPFIIFDFANVDVIGPGFANTAFAHFVCYAPPFTVLQKIRFVNITKVKRAIIEEEIKGAY